MLKHRLPYIGIIMLLCTLPIFWLLAQEESQNTQEPNTQEPDTQQQNQELQSQNAPENLPNDVTSDDVASDDVASAPATTNWYRSNQLAMKLELLTDPRLLGQQEWGLEEEQSDQQRLKSLYYQGQLQQTWLLTYRNGKPFQEQHKQGNILLENRFYDEDTGLISENTRYNVDNPESIEERLLYFYDSLGNLTRSMRYDDQGQLLSQNIYYLGVAGQLVKLNIKMFSKNQELTQYQLDHLQTLIQDRNLGRGKKYQINFYNTSRQNTNQIIYLDDKVRERIDFNYAPNKNLIKSVITAENQVEEYNYDNQQRLIQKQTWKNNALFETELYRYDGLARLANKEINNWKNNEKNEERYTYQGQSTDPQKIEYYLNDQIDKIRIYSALYEYSEELFFNGVSVAEVFYSYDDERSNEVTFENPPSPAVYDEGIDN